MSFDNATNNKQQRSLVTISEIICFDPSQASAQNFLANCEKLVSNWYVAIKFWMRISKKALWRRTNCSSGVKVAGMFLLPPSLVLFHQLIYMMATTYNFAVLKFKSREDCCTKFWAVFMFKSTARHPEAAPSRQLPLTSNELKSKKKKFWS